MATTLTADDTQWRKPVAAIHAPAPQAQGAGTTVASADRLRGLTGDTPDLTPAISNPKAVARAHVSVNLVPRYAEIVHSRNTLAHKEAIAALTPAEAARLSLVRWQIDQIEDAIGGPHLDVLEEFTAKHEQVARQVEDVLARMKGQSPTVFQPRKSRRGR
ncbi:MAG: hypothetical protein JNK64_27190 [Myxococcales bacterium]|nr:hypothetical protein [Myxococcales bacterium]